MTVRELINALLDYNMDAVVTVMTENKDSEGRTHTYEFTGINKAIGEYSNCMDWEQTVYLPLAIHNWEFDHKANGEENADG